METFICALHKLAKACEFPKKNDQIIDCLVIGLQNKDLSERLQLIPVFLFYSTVWVATFFFSYLISHARFHSLIPNYVFSMFLPRNKYHIGAINK